MELCCADHCEIVQHPDDVLTGRDTRDRAGEDIVEHKRGDADLGECSAQGLFHDAIDAASREHRAALDVDCADRVREDIDAQDQPGRSFTYRLFGEAAGVKGRRAEVVENNRRSSPEGDKGEHDRRRHDKAYPVRLW